MSRKPDVEARKLRPMSRQTMVAVPAWVLRRLGVRAGRAVYWHGHRPGEVVVSASKERRRGPAGRADLEGELRQVAAERDELKQSLTSNRLAGARANYAQAYLQAMRYLGPLSDRMEALMRKVDAVIARDHGRPGDALRFRRARAHGRGRGVDVVALPDAVPSPSPTPSSEVSGGAAASGGETPQAAHE